MMKRLNYIKIVLRPQRKSLEHLNSLNQSKIELECINLDDSDKPLFTRIKLFKSQPIFSILIRKCNLQEQKFQTQVMQHCHKIYVFDSFMKFWFKDIINVREMVVNSNL